MFIVAMVTNVVISIHITFIETSSFRPLNIPTITTTIETTQESKTIAEEFPLYPFSAKVFGLPVENGIQNTTFKIFLKRLIVISVFSAIMNTYISRISHFPIYFPILQWLCMYTCKQNQKYNRKNVCIRAYLSYLEIAISSDSTSSMPCFEDGIAFICISSSKTELTRGN